MTTKPCYNGIRPLTGAERAHRYRQAHPEHWAKATIAMRAWRADRRDLALAARSVGGKV